MSKLTDITPDLRRRLLYGLFVMFVKTGLWIGLFGVISAMCGYGIIVKSIQGQIQFNIYYLIGLIFIGLSWYALIDVGLKFLKNFRLDWAQQQILISEGAFGAWPSINRYWRDSSFTIKIDDSLVRFNGDMLAMSFWQRLKLYGWLASGVPIEIAVLPHSKLIVWLKLSAPEPK